MLKKKFAVLTLFDDLTDDPEDDCLTLADNYAEVKPEDVREMIEFRNKYIENFERGEKEIFDRYSAEEKEQQ